LSGRRGGGEAVLGRVCLGSRHLQLRLESRARSGLQFKFSLQLLLHLGTPPSPAQSFGLASAGSALALLQVPLERPYPVPERLQLEAPGRFLIVRQPQSGGVHVGAGRRHAGEGDGCPRGASTVGAGESHLPHALLELLATAAPVQQVGVFGCELLAECRQGRLRTLGGFSRATRRRTSKPRRFPIDAMPTFSLAREVGSECRIGVAEPPQQLVGVAMALLGLVKRLLHACELSLGALCPCLRLHCARQGIERPLPSGRSATTTL